MIELFPLILHHHKLAVDLMIVQKGVVLEASSVPNEATAKKKWIFNIYNG